MDDNKVTGFESLYESMNKCKTNVMWKDSTANFVNNSIRKCLNLSKALTDYTYVAKPTRTFTVMSAKPREVMGVTFRDRVYQRSLNDNYIYGQMTKGFIYDNAACQKGKGTHFARNRLHCFLQKFYRRYGIDGYILQCDIKGYYPSMRHDYIESVFEEKLEEPALSRTKKILSEQYDGDTGYYPGSQLIQIAGIAALDGLDHFIKERLRVKYYIRYMDDFILIHHDKTYLQHCKEVISTELAKIGFSLHQKKTRIVPITTAIKFLGFYHRLTITGKIVATMDPKTVKRERKKLLRLAHLVAKGRIDDKKYWECYQSWRQSAIGADTHRLVERMDRYSREILEKAKQQGIIGV